MLSVITIVQCNSSRAKIRHEGIFFRKHYKTKSWPIPTFAAPSQFLHLLLENTAFVHTYAYTRVHTCTHTQLPSGWDWYQLTQVLALSKRSCFLVSRELLIVLGRMSTLPHRLHSIVVSYSLLRGRSIYETKIYCLEKQHEASAQ